MEEKLYHTGSEAAEEACCVFFQPNVSLSIRSAINLQHDEWINLGASNKKLRSAKLRDEQIKKKKKLFELIYEKPFVQLLSTDQKELKHTCCQLFIFIILCVSHLPQEVQINTYSQESHGINGRFVFRTLQLRLLFILWSAFTNVTHKTRHRRLSKRKSAR